MRIDNHAERVADGRRSAARRMFARVVLDDHVRLPWRFFGRLTAAIPADLSRR
jgi:hypothetical protein